MAEMGSESCDLIGFDKDPTVENETLSCPNSHTELLEENIDSMDEDTMASMNQEISPAQGPTLPILQKVINLSNSLQNLKTEHEILSNQVKSFPAHDIVGTLQLLNNEYELLKKKYLDESSERKRLYNEVIELKGNIRVFCRCRPLNQVEISNGSSSVVEFDSSQDAELQIISSDYSKKQFKFDHVFGPEDGQDVVFAQTKPIVTSVLDGFNVCIFAYGQTGTGKTFTMEGTPENRGVNYRTLEELFRVPGERGGVMKYELFVSMMEVYNEKIRDLLGENSNQHTKRLDIKQTADGIQEVPGLVEASVYSTEEVWELLKSGNRVRSVGATNANEMSSRSHCLLRVNVRGTNLINGQKTRSHLWLVDLAGSERFGKIEVEGERLKESQFINKSLSALGDVISALASKTSYIPYRNSKLTHMLQSSLGGDCKTVMFVQISPSNADLGETLCSLNFASRVRGIESGPALKQVDLTELYKYKQLAEKLKHDDKETKKLQDNVQSLQLRLSAREHICKSLQEKVRDLENQLAEERKTRLKQETRAFAASASTRPPLKQAAEKTKTDKKPPLGPSKVRLPLRRITNFIPPATPLATTNRKISRISMVASSNDKENNSETVMAPKTNRENLLKPRRSSIAVKPQTANAQVLQPKRRVSIVAIRPDSHMTTPLRRSTSGFNNGTTDRPSLARDARKARYSRFFSPLPEFRKPSSPAAMRSSSKFMGSPPGAQAGSWKPRHPTVVALQRKSLVWSPLKLKGMQSSYRKSSFLPLRPSSERE
ncbi:Eukaryotic translation initiation factor 3E [Hibiscus syriacus]|uniref:Kinesin-like protein n=1 Tax=Hibiscus syriacus TaxID=106335 RepID=A0A6A2XGF2_HIBSY|nr:kinesin-like protein KIN-14S [Hibiscus syriacus]KAE8668860.1 Eukaryotic translation initiation factor 3E [Hibiscus syriacus]